MPATCTAARHLTWGTFRVDAGSAFPEWPWHVLTDSQADSLYLWWSGLSQNAVALAYGVSQPAVHKHIKTAMRRLARQPRPVVEYPPRPGRVPCVECENPHLSCCDCIARLIGFETGFVCTPQGRRRQASADAVLSRQLPHAVNLRHVRRRHKRDDDWHLSHNPHFRERDDDDRD
jgi:DNA-binding CsgD family transcriptional regulator